MTNAERAADNIKDFTFTEMWQLAEYITGAVNDMSTQLKQDEQFSEEYFAHLFISWADYVQAESNKE